MLKKCINSENIPIILEGDFNARLGEHDGGLPYDCLKDTTLLPTRKSQDTQITSRGLALLNFISGYDFILLNGRTPDDSRGNMTHFGPNGASVVDLIWTNHNAAKFISSLHVGENSYRSDHFPIQVMLKSTCQNIHTKTAPTQPPTRKLIWKAEHAQKFVENLFDSSRLDITYLDSSIDTLASNLHMAIHEVAYSTGLKITVKHGIGQRTSKKNPGRTMNSNGSNLS